MYVSTDKFKASSSKVFVFCNIIDTIVFYGEYHLKVSC